MPRKSKEPKFGEPIPFYNGEVILKFDQTKHVYYREYSDGRLEPQEGVTGVCKMLDRSLYLIPWAVKMSATKLLATMPRETDELGGVAIQPISWQQFEELVNQSKNAHREKKEDAGDVGTAAHTWLEDSIRWAIAHDGIVHELTGRKPDDPRAVSCGEAAFSWMQQHSVKWKKTEHKVYSRSLEYAGTMDGLAEVAGELCIIDWKTANYFDKSWLFQTAAYQFAETEEFGTDVKKRWILRLGKESEEFEAFVSEPEDFALDFAVFKLLLAAKRNIQQIENRISCRKKAAKEKKNERARET